MAAHFFTESLKKLSQIFKQPRYITKITQILKAKWPTHLDNPPLQAKLFARIKMLLQLIEVTN